MRLNDTTTDAAGAGGGAGDPAYGGNTGHHGRGPGSADGNDGASSNRVERLQGAVAAAQHLLHIYNEIIGDDHEMRDTLLEGETDFHAAAAAVLDKVAETQTLVSAIKGRIEALKARQERYETYQERLRSALLEAMAAVEAKSLKLPDATVSRSVGRQKVEIVDETLIPAVYEVPQPPKINKLAIYEALKFGAVVAGARLAAPTDIITIRWK